MCHREALFERNDTVVHEQGGGGRSHARDKADLLILVEGDASPDVCQYPSQTSVLSRNGEPAWQPLISTLDVAPPTVELLDG